MDRNSIIGIILIALIFVFWSIFTKPSAEDRERMQRRQDSIAQLQKQQTQKNQNTAPANTFEEGAKQLPDSVQSQIINSKYGAFSSAASDSNQYYVLENDKLKLTISNKGGRPYSVQLKEYNRYDSSALILFNGESTRFGLVLPTNQNIPINTNDLYFKLVGSQNKIVVTKGQNPATFALRLDAGTGKYLEYVYTLAPESYMVDFKINMVGMDSVIASNYNSLSLKYRSFCQCTLYRDGAFNSIPCHRPYGATERCYRKRWYHAFGCISMHHQG